MKLKHFRYNYHLLEDALDVIDAGTSLTEVVSDIDCEDRIFGNGMDIGADEFFASSATNIVINDLHLLLSK